ncbi:MAG: hypothetical protein GF320_17550 [Armatimonadia bacterium]|nr:hypothetical protein [Armatimonadia bacterium]
MGWTHFYDSYYMGCEKDKKTHIYIEAGRDEALNVFRHRFGQEPTELDCACCGRRYLVAEHPSLDRATKVWREQEGVDLDTFLAADHVAVIRASEITDADLSGELPQPGEAQDLKTGTCGMRRGQNAIPSFGYSE